MREFELVRRISSVNRRLPPDVLIPPGDDMAALALPNPTEVLAAADAAIEGRHTPFGCDPFLIGRKAVLRNLSDVAAMGGARPIGTLACVTLPRETDSERAWRLLEGIRETAERWGAPLIGGDTATYPAETQRAPIIASVTILALRRTPSSRLVTRADARIGDAVYVTGTIGGAWDARTGLGRHLDFEPRLAAAAALEEALGDRLGAMIDVSDGLGRDLAHIARASQVGISIELDRIPVGPEIDARAAIAHGEDYELAFTARGDVPAHAAGVPVTRIGIVTAGVGRVLAHQRSASGVESFDASELGFEHGGGSGGVTG